MRSRKTLIRSSTSQTLAAVGEEYTKAQRGNPLSPAWARAKFPRKIYDCACNIWIQTLMLLPLGGKPKPHLESSPPDSTLNSQAFNHISVQKRLQNHKALLPPLHCYKLIGSTFGLGLWLVSGERDFFLR